MVWIRRILSFGGTPSECPIALVGLLVLLMLRAGDAATYYVDQNSIGGSCSDSAAGTSEQAPWCSIGRANAAVQPGDTVLIRQGTYEEAIAPGCSGIEGQRITYRSYPGEMATLTGVSRGVAIVGRAHIVIDRITCDNTNTYVLLEGSHHIWIQNSTFIRSKSEGGWPVGVIMQYNSHHNWLHHCTIGRVGYAATTDDEGGVVSIGRFDDDEGSDFNLVEDNVLYHGGHHACAIYSKYNVVRRNYIHNENWMKCSRDESDNRCGNRCLLLEGLPGGAGWNLVEENYIAFSGVPPDQYSSPGFSLRTPHNIVRRNFFYHCDSSGIIISTHDYAPLDVRFNHVFHNVFYHNGYPALSVPDNEPKSGLTLYRHGGGAEITDVSIVNNIFFRNGCSGISWGNVEPEKQHEADNWDDDAGDPLFVSVEEPMDPLDSQRPQFELTKGSPCIDAGGFVTHTVSAGSGTVMPVTDSGYFTGGWGIIEGDSIQLAGQRARVRIVHIDYDKHQLTLESTLTWEKGQGVAFPYEGSAPDIGAFEFGLTFPEPRPPPAPPAHLRIK